jgi:type II secretory pathway pseudopilin PulG
MHKDDNGFSYLEVLIVIIVIGLMVIVGWGIWSKSHKSNSTKVNAQLVIPINQVLNQIKSLIAEYPVYTTADNSGSKYTPDSYVVSFSNTVNNYVVSADTTASLSIQFPAVTLPVTNINAIADIQAMGKLIASTLKSNNFSYVISPPIKDYTANLVTAGNPSSAYPSNPYPGGYYTSPAEVCFLGYYYDPDINYSDMGLNCVTKISLNIVANNIKPFVGLYMTYVKNNSGNNYSTNPAFSNPTISNSGNGSYKYATVGINEGGTIYQSGSYAAVYYSNASGNQWNIFGIYPGSRNSPLCSGLPVNSDAQKALSSYCVNEYN